MATRDPNLWYSKDGVDYGYDSKPLKPATSLTGGYKALSATAAPATQGFDFSKQAWNFKPATPTINQYGGAGDGVYGPPAPQRSLLDNPWKTVTLEDKANQAAASVTPASLTTAMNDYYNTLKQHSDDAYGKFQDRYNAILNRVNPNDPNSEAFKTGLKQAQDNMTRAFNGAERAYMSKVAGGRGMGGYNAAGIGNIISGRAQGYANATNQAYTDLANKYQAFESNRDNALMSLTGAMNADPGNALMGLANYQAAQSRLPYELESMSLANQQAREMGPLQKAQAQANLALTQQDYEMAKQINPSIIEAKIAEAKAAKAKGALEQWESENAGWLGAIRAYVEIEKTKAQVAGGVLGTVLG